MSIQDVSNNLLTGSIWSPKTLNKIECCGAKFAYGQLDMTWERLIRLILNMMKRPKNQFSETDFFMSCWYFQEKGVTTGVVSLLEWWSTQRANDRCKDYPDGQLATISAPEHSVSYFFWDTLYLKIVTSAQTTLMGNFLAMWKGDS